MGPYQFVTAALTGFFLFGAIYHAILWLRAPRERAQLAFTLLALVSAVHSVAVFRLNAAADSEPGSGTTFRFHLPAAVGDAREEAGKPGEPVLAPGGETILLVEDEAAVRDMTQAVLERRGYRVLPATSGAEALETARATRGHIDLVLTDVVMPGMSGPQLVGQLRQEQSDAAVVYMSGYATDAMLRQGVETGEAVFLQKPFAAAALATKLRQVLDEAG
jgi:CheY-like chemotaxis protein